MKLNRPYPIAALIIAFIVIVGFWPTYFGLLASSKLDLQAIVHGHAIVFSAWVVLLVTQTSLAARGRTDLHMRLGAAGIVLGTLVLIFGVWVSFNQMTNGIAAGRAEEAQRFLIVPLGNMLMFLGFFLAAVANRSTPKYHKRLMMVATISLLDAPISRMSFLGDPPNPALLFVVWFAPLIVLMVSDHMQGRKLSRIYLLGIGVMVLSGLRFPLAETEGWLAIARLLSGAS